MGDTATIFILQLYPLLPFKLLIKLIENSYFI
nr:MAG TPA: hypothetical protein [Caudoviricetes sp.]